MNDLDLLKAFRQEVPDPDPERVRAAWTSLWRTLEDHGPPVPRRWSGRRARLAVASGAVAAAVAVTLALPALLPGGAASAEAARVLRRLAGVAADQPPQPPPAPGQYVYTRSRGFQTYLYVTGRGLSNIAFRQWATREVWIGPDGSGRLLESRGDPEFLSAQDRAAWVAAGRPVLDPTGRTTDDAFGPGGLHFLDLSGLPTDPQELLAVIEEREIVGGPEGDWETFVIVGDLLRETYAPPALRAALYEVAANLPGVEYVGVVQDDLGRRGVAVASTHGGVRHELIFDPETARLLGERQVMVDPGETGLEVGAAAQAGTVYGGWGEPGTVVSSTLYLESGIVGSREETP
jgi:hypothetical protein